MYDDQFCMFQKNISLNVIRNHMYNLVTNIKIFLGFVVVVIVAVIAFDVLFFGVDFLDVAVADVIVNAELTDDVASAVAVAFAAVVATVHASFADVVRPLPILLLFLLLIISSIQNRIGFLYMFGFLIMQCFDVLI